VIIIERYSRNGCALNIRNVRAEFSIQKNKSVIESRIGLPAQNFKEHNLPSSATDRRAGATIPTAAPVE
jgi:hypothetical protein